MSKQGLVVLAVLGAIGLGLWLLLKPKRLPAPAIVDVVALDTSGNARAISAGEEPTLAPAEGLDFHVQLEAPGWIYVFRSIGKGAALEWGPGVETTPFEKGIWAADWGDVRGLHFPDGDATLYVLTSPDRLEGAHQWTQSELLNPSLSCPHCGVTSMDIHVARRK
jgi:hypothetical protein